MEKPPADYAARRVEAMQEEMAWIKIRFKTG